MGHLFLGINLGGPIGETSKLALVLAGLFLVFTHTIRIRIPLIYLTSLGLAAFLWSGFDSHFALTHVLSGTAVFGAIFMVTDYSSSPITPRGHEFFAMMAALLAFLLRIIFNLPGGFGIALIIMNFFTPWIDKYLAPRIYGHSKTPQTNSYREKQNHKQSV